MKTALSPATANRVVAAMDAFWAPTLAERQVTGPGRKRLLVNELVSAFFNVDPEYDQIMRAVYRIREDQAQTPDRPGSTSRPSAAAIRRRFDQLDLARVPAEPCALCHQHGRRHVTAVVWRELRARAVPLVVACDCPHGDALVTDDDEPVLPTLSWWARQTELGRERLLGVLEINPVWCDVVTGALRRCSEALTDDDKRAAHDAVQAMLEVE